MATKETTVHSSQIPSTSSVEDAEFVEAVMAASNTPRPVDANNHGGKDTRKRQLSHEDSTANSKKLKESEPTMGELAHLIVNLENSMNDRMNQLEGRLMDKLRESILVEINDVRDSLSKQINTLKERVLVLEDKFNSDTPIPTNPQPDTTHRLVIINLPAHPIENVSQKLNTMIKEGLDLPNITVTSAERKLSRTDKPGVVIAQCNSADDVQKILERKANLKENTRYKSVYINRDIPLAQRIHNANMRAIVNVIGKDKLELKGNVIRQKSTSTHSGQSYSQAVRHNDRNSTNNGRQPSNNNNNNNSNNNSNNNNNTNSRNTTNNNGRQNYRTRNSGNGNRNRQN
ncbi:MAG: hypothetical protein ABW168_16890 [Sedimenticola sp.]